MKLANIKKIESPTMDTALEQALHELKRRGYLPNFFFVGHSVLHAAALNAFLSRLKSDGIDPCGVVCSNTSAPGIPQFYKEDIFSVNPDKLIYLQNEVDYQIPHCSIYQKIKSKLFPEIPTNARKASSGEAESRVFYLIATDEDYPPPFLWKIASSQGMAVKCILVEEGAASYLPRESIHLFFARAKNKSAYLRALKLLKCKAGGVLRTRYRSKIDACCSVERFSAYKKKSADGRLYKNDDFTLWMKRSLQEYCLIKEIPAVDFSRKVVIVGADFQDFGEEQLERTFLSRLARVVQAAGLTPYFRPHPRTRNPGKYKSLGMDVDELGKIPFEAELAGCDNFPVAIVGLGSSSQMFANAFWEIPCFSVAPILLDEASKSNADIRSIEAFVARINEFCLLLSEHIISVDNDKTLFDLLRNRA